MNIQEIFTNPLFILAQVFGALTFAFEIIATQKKLQKNIIFYNTISNIFNLLQFILLSAWTGTFMAVYHIIRCLVFYIFLIKKKKPNISILIIFFAIIIANGIATWTGYITLGAIVGGLFATYALWQQNAKITRICFFISDALWAIYCFPVGAIVDGISLIIQDIMMAISIYRFDIKKESEEK
ncbi:MAG: YgjV family protein [Clostridiales bacterium]|jgi:hypothetical protein|nr:YgjV family protein [Clostridiales bacterium]